MPEDAAGDEKLVPPLSKESKVLLTERVEMMHREIERAIHSRSLIAKKRDKSKTDKNAVLDMILQPLAYNKRMKVRKWKAP